MLYYFLQRGIISVFQNNNKIFAFRALLCPRIWLLLSSVINYLLLVGLRWHTRVSAIPDVSVFKNQGTFTLASSLETRYVSLNPRIWIEKETSAETQRYGFLCFWSKSRLGWIMPYYKLVPFTKVKSRRSREFSLCVAAWNSEGEVRTQVKTRWRKTGRGRSWTVDPICAFDIAVQSFPDKRSLAW